MAQNLETVRTVMTVHSNDARDVRTLEVLKDDSGSYWLYDVDNDPNADALEELAEDSDINIMDLIGPNGFEIVNA